MSESLTLEGWLDKLSHLHSKEIDLGLDRVRAVGERLGVLRPAPFVITVAGTNGKGSSVAMLQSILLASGYRVGSYTSPHILRFNERIQLNGADVSDTQIIQAFEAIEQASAQCTLTYFEFATLAALIVFNQADLDYVVLEVGLGGRLDAVNIVDADACLITSIDIDHADWLGTDREAIGFEKAGVMRPHRLAVCSDPYPPVSLVNHARNLGVDLRLINQAYCYKILSTEWQFTCGEIQWVLPKPALLGDFQCQNAAGVVCLLLVAGVALTEASLRKGLVSLHHPGRLQSMSLGNQAWLFDVAHNPQSVCVLAQFIEQQPRTRRLAIFAGLADKDLVPMIKVMQSHIDHWILVDLAVPRATPLAVLNEICHQAGIPEQQIDSFHQMKAAIAFAQSLAVAQVVVYGSFITISQALGELDG
ncbi:bifunctional tetrahydrofolate synthase/dihydrofolate synthase [Thiomicrospira microaerophila]|uniref:bifunctional tetrahydrofolate synthase/dihydrofolate synthase n=1 Tax=Thiomicrospira microaerophila TaxID=406020 RepID=UPI0006988145|nr:bifunctional tetrahydrofolate synthase/dihydrofolate synthase [Thiomicrospira microaerophila]